MKEHIVQINDFLYQSGICRTFCTLLWMKAISLHNKIHAASNNLYINILHRSNLVPGKKEDCELALWLLLILLLGYIVITILWLGKCVYLWYFLNSNVSMPKSKLFINDTDRCPHSEWPQPRMHFFPCLLDLPVYYFHYFLHHRDILWHTGEINSLWLLF